MPSSLPAQDHKPNTPKGTTPLYSHLATLRALQHPGSIRKTLIQALYIHIPFCFHKCHYCDFYSIVDRDDRQAAFTDRLIAELAAHSNAVTQATGSPPTPRTIFAGGGTPTLLQPQLWQKLLAALHTHLDTSNLTEFTVEANPETVTPQLMSVLAAGGVNRVSIGCQSFNPAHLKTLERWHDPDSVPRAVQHTTAAGITNYNLDLIYAIPHQTLDEWHDDLRRALELNPSHLSCYALTYEPNTPMTHKLSTGNITQAENELEAAMFTATINTLAKHGYEQYEVSNFARPNHRCQHNLGYWLSHNWLPLGPGAAAHINGTRWKNQPRLGKYLASSDGAPIQDIEQLPPDQQLGEQLMLRLRLIEGARLDWLEPLLDTDRRAVIQHHIYQQHLEQTPTHLRFTPAGLLIADTVLADLL